MRAPIWTLVTASVAFAPPAAAQDESVTLDLARMAELGDDGFVVPRPFTLRDGAYSVRLGLDYGFRPLSFAASGGGLAYDVVRHRMTGTLALGFAVSDHVTIAASLPLGMVSEGDDPSAFGLPAADGRIAGDPAVTLRARLLGEEGDAFVLGMALRLTLPLAASTASVVRYSGDESVTVQPSVLAELRLGDDLRVNVTLGGRFRPVARQATLVVGQELTFGASATYEVVEDRLDVIGELYGATDLGVLARRANSPAEILAGFVVHPDDRFELRAAVGTGFTAGYGASDVRATAMFGYVMPPPDPPAAAADEVADGEAPEDPAAADEPEEATATEDATVTPPGEPPPVAIGAAGSDSLESPGADDAAAESTVDGERTAAPTSPPVP